MSETIIATGLVATEPRRILTAANVPITSFRLASAERRFKKELGTWEYTESNFFTVTTYRRLAENANGSIRKGDRVMVTGKTRLREYVRTDGEKGFEIIIDADSLGHDLNGGTSVFHKNPKSETAPASGADGSSDGTDGGVESAASTSDSSDGDDSFVPGDSGDGWSSVSPSATVSV